MIEIGTPPVIRRFSSKQNDVSLMRWGEPPRLCVAKRFTDPAKLEKELRISARIREIGMRAPAVLGRSEDTVLYEYVEGKTLCALLDEAEAFGDRAAVLHGLVLLCGWLGTFHDATGLAFHDINLRNFVLRDGTLYGFDYEDARDSAYESDYGRLLAFILTYNPAFSDLKLYFCRCLLFHMCEVGVEKSAVLNAMKLELEAMRTRRAVEYPLAPEAAVSEIGKGIRT